MKLNKLQKFYLSLILIFITATSFNSCYYDSEEYLYSGLICDSTDVSFSADVVPILEANCYVCHSIENADESGEGYILETYEELNASTDGETLIDVVDWLDGGASDMPKGGSQLPDCQRAVIRNWVNEGMLNN